MLHFVICDDNLNILDKLEKMLENIFTKNNFDAKVSFTSDNSDKILEYIKSNPSDVLLLDINLKSNKTGLELAEEIRKIKKNSYLIFTTMPRRMFSVIRNTWFSSSNTLFSPSKPIT